MEGISALIISKKDSCFLKEFSNPSNPMSETFIRREQSTQYLMGLFKRDPFAEGAYF